VGLQHVRHEVIVETGQNLEGDEYSGWTELPADLVPVGKYFYAQLFLAASVRPCVVTRRSAALTAWAATIVDHDQCPLGCNRRLFQPVKR
jgi:hypothetical protein